MHSCRIRSRGRRLWVGCEAQELAEHARKKFVKTRPKAASNTNLAQQKGKPWCTSYYFKFMTPIYVSITCALGLGIVWNSSCMIPRFPGPYTSMCRSVALLCLIGLGRSRVISYYSRDIGCPYVLLYELLCSRWDGWKIGDRAGNV